MALVAAAGVWMGLSGEPALAAKSTAKATKTSAASADRPLVLSKYKKHKRAGAARKSRTAQARHMKKSASRVADNAVRKADTADKNSKSQLPPEIANAHAQALAADEARNIAALDTTNVSISNGVMIAANDPPKGSDAAPMDSTAASEDASPPAPVAAAPPPPLPAGKIIRAVPSGERPVVKAEDSDTWNKTSLIGKIFIAFGGLLTLASAARLLIA